MRNGIRDVRRRLAVFLFRMSGDRSVNAAPGLGKANNAPCFPAHAGRRVQAQCPIRPSRCRPHALRARQDVRAWVRTDARAPKFPRRCNASLIVSPFPRECLSGWAGGGVALQGKPMVRGLGAYGSNRAPQPPRDLGFRHPAFRQGLELPDGVFGPAVASRRWGGQCVLRANRIIDEGPSVQKNSTNR